MSILLIASSGPRAGRSLIAAAMAHRLARAGKAVTLARLEGDESAAADAATFSTVEGVPSPGRPLSPEAVKGLTGDAVVEAPPGAVAGLAATLGARVLAVGGATSPPVDVPPELRAGTVVTPVAAAQVRVVSGRAGVVAVLPEDVVLAAPSVVDIAGATRATWLAGEPAPDGIEQVMIGTIASDAAAPYFGAHARTCVITRADKTDVQLAALMTNLRCLVLTGGRHPSPYLLDRVRSEGGDIAVLLTSASTVETMRAVEELFCASRFDGAVKLARAVALLDAAGAPVEV
jgi:hypothetical protein